MSRPGGSPVSYHVMTSATRTVLLEAHGTTLLEKDVEELLIPLKQSCAP